MPKMTASPMSTKDSPETYIWIILDRRGEFVVTNPQRCKSITEALSKPALARACNKARDAFANQGGPSTLAGKLIDPMTGRAF